MLDAAENGAHPLLRARYGADAPAAAWSPVIEGMPAHRSVRAYADTPLPPGTLEALVAAGQSASTSSNLQAWSVVAVEDAGRRERLAALAGGQKHVAQAPLFLCWVADLSRAERVGAAAGIAMEGLPYLEAFLVACMDAALAAQNAVVAAESLGLGTVYIGGMRNHPDQVAEELQLPPQAFVVFGLCVGYPTEDLAVADVKPRLPQRAVLHRERYDPAPELASLGAYDAELLAFQARQEMKPQPWTELIRRRLGRVSGLGGRDTLRTTLEKMGFRFGR